MSREDSVDRHVERWLRELPHLDPRVEAIVTRMDVIVRYLRRRKEEALAGHGLKPAEYAILHEIVRAGAPYRVSPSALAARIGVPATTMTSRLERAEANGLITRVLDPEDRRHLLVELTAAGRAAWEAAMREQDDAEKALLAALGDGQRDELASLLREITLAIEDERTL